MKKTANYLWNQSSIPNEVHQKSIVSNVSNLTKRLEMSSSINMGVNGNNTKHVKDDTYKEKTNYKNEILTKILKPVNVMNEATYAISNHTLGNNTRSTLFDLLMSDDGEIPDNLNLDLSKTWDVVEPHEAVSNKSESEKWSIKLMYF